MKGVQTLRPRTVARESFAEKLLAAETFYQEGLAVSLMTEQANAFKLLSEGNNVLCGQLLLVVMDYKLGKTNAPLVDRSVVLVICRLVSLVIDQVKSLFLLVIIGELTEV